MNVSLYKILFFLTIPNCIWPMDTFLSEVSSGPNREFFLKKIEQAYNDELAQLKSYYKISAVEFEQNVSNPIELYRKNDPLFKIPLTPLEEPYYDESDDPLLPGYSQLMKKEALSMNLNPEKIFVSNTQEHVAHITTKNDYPDGQLRNTLFINLEVFKSLNSDETIAIIRHELAHLIYLDYLTETFIVTLLQKKGHLKTVLQKYPRKKQFFSSMEYRADLLAASSLQHALQLKKLFSHTLKHFEEQHKDYTIHNSHPSWADRLKVIDALIKSFENPQKISPQESYEDIMLKLFYVN